MLLGVTGSAVRRMAAGLACRLMIDSLTRHPPGAVFDPDLCVIGAGPVGIAIVREFLDDTTRVLLLESGGESPDARPRP